MWKTSVVLISASMILIFCGFKINVERLQVKNNDWVSVSFTQDTEKVITYGANELSINIIKHDYKINSDEGKEYIRNHNIKCIFYMFVIGFPDTYTTIRIKQLELSVNEKYLATYWFTEDPSCPQLNLYPSHIPHSFIISSLEGSYECNVNNLEIPDQDLLAISNAQKVEFEIEYSATNVEGYLPSEVIHYKEKGAFSPALINEFKEFCNYCGIK